MQKRWAKIKKEKKMYENFLFFKVMNDKKSNSSNQEICNPISMKCSDDT